MPNTQFIYNNLLNFTAGYFDIGALYKQGLLTFDIIKKIRI